MPSKRPSDKPDWHGRRHGKKLRPGHKALVENRLPALRVTAQNPDPDFAATMAGVPAQLWLEIGFGGGEHLAAQARAHPDIGFIGAEPFINGVAKLLSAISDGALQNIRICDDDARPLLDAMAENSVDRAFVLFSDPWPKRRQNKRRFIVKENLDRLARVMKDGAELRFASDHMGFVSWSLQALIEHPCFSWNARRANDWRIPPEDWQPTRYEEKALARGERPAYLLFSRLAR
ncbi:MAG: tRNA (guanosine(46)-N7)-methyltransferase TrmB [Rhodospirillales bacterium]|nr:tRNA (guanosine(46)-N7)-methyltransferase TrmB [Rhodospirillales bacterium]